MFQWDYSFWILIGVELATQKEAAYVLASQFIYLFLFLRVAFYIMSMNSDLWTPCKKLNL